MTQKQLSKPDSPDPGTCAHVWDEVDEDTSQISDGQQTDYLAGMWRSFTCAKCGLTETRDGPFPTED